MEATKEELIKFLDDNILTLVENNPRATDTIKKKVNITRTRLYEQVSA